MNSDEISIPYVTFVNNSGEAQIADAGHARVPVGIELQRLEMLVRKQLQVLTHEANERKFCFSWYGSNVLLQSLSGEVNRSMANHLLVAVEDTLQQGSQLEMLYALASHHFAGQIKNVRHGAPERTVFVVHGHNEKALQRLAAFLESQHCIPLILSRMPRQGSETIVEALERVLPAAALVVALFTEDDEGRERAGHDALLRPRARQNVLVEAGFAIIQRRSHSIIVVLGDVEIPSDFGGILTVRDKEWGFQVESQLADFINARL